jgi:molecular chaperone GrpE
VQEVQSRFDQLRQQLQRETDETTTAFESFRRRTRAGEKAKFISSLLPALDDLNRAIDAPQSQKMRLEKRFWKDSQYRHEFSEALTNAGVEPISSVGEEFNPELHEAVDTEETSRRDGRKSN